MSKRVLLTAATEDIKAASDILSRSEELQVLHLPLEKYAANFSDNRIEKTLNELDSYENIVHGNWRNTRFFIEAVKKYEKIEEIKNRLNLTVDDQSAEALEEMGIPAICTYGDKKPINLVEFMLRLRRLGSTLYPCGSHKKEDVPALLMELDIPVTELELFELEGPDKEEVETYRSQLEQESPDVILFHSRRSVTRTLVAFENLNFEETIIISADRGITEKLEKEGIPVDGEGSGTWQSMIELV